MTREVVDGEVRLSDEPGVEPTENQAPVRLFGWHSVLSLGVTLALLVGMLFFVDLKSAWTEIRQCDLRLVLLATLAHYATYPVRGARWRRTLKHVRRDATTAKFGLVVFFYNAVDNLVPAKLGDVYGAHMACINFGVSRAAALGSIVFVRMVDAWFILGLAATSSLAVFSTQMPSSIVWALILGGIIAVGASILVVTVFVLRHTMPAWLPLTIRTRIHSARIGMWPRRSQYLAIATHTILLWILESTWILLLVRAFGITLAPMELVFLTTIPLLASAFPLTPSGAGVVELTLFSCLRALGIASPLAVSVTVLNRLIDYWLHIALGSVTWGMRHLLGLRVWRGEPLQEALVEESEEPGPAV